jgi:hypothetical protein
MKLRPDRPGLDGKFFAKNLLIFQLSLHHITLNTPKGICSEQ